MLFNYSITAMQANQPRNRIVGKRNPVPTIEMATGIIRTAVRLRTAYARLLHEAVSKAGAAKLAPKARNTRSIRSCPSASRKS